MLTGLRRFFIYLFSAAFVVNGGLVHASIELPPALTAHAHVGITVAVEHAVHHDAASPGPVQSAMAPSEHAYGITHEHMDGGAKCCGMCGMANAMPELTTIPVQLSYAAITFHVRLQGLNGHLTKLDPDIPKAIA